ncbi:MAG: transaldolase [Actinobacteria bacterium]|nr:transaldolase [Actinomycetota bacterium]
MTSSRLRELFDQTGQSPWLDNLKREYLLNGEFERVISNGIRGLTSNPTIFQKAIQGSALYDHQFLEVAEKGVSTEEIFWELVISDITDAADIFHPLYTSSSGLDGYVSVEVSPELAHDCDGTIAAAQNLHDRIGRRNVMIKIPATEACIPAIEEVISRGINVNVTLIFGLERYQEVMDAYIRGITRLKSLNSARVQEVSSVASFFISRVDSEIDRQLDALSSENALGLRGKAAIAQAKVAYAMFEKTFGSSQWQTLAQMGAQVQRPLWASTSTKNPEYPDTIYVDQLIGPHSVNTLPDSTMEAFSDHGSIEETITKNVDEAHRTLSALQSIGINMLEVADKLEREGVASFAQSFVDVLQVLEDKRNR